MHKHQEVAIAGSTAQVNPHPKQVTVETEIRFDLIDYWRSITKRKWQILAFALVVTAVATLVNFALAPQYQAVATVLIESSRPKLLSVEEVYAGVSANREYFQTQAEIIESQDVALKTIKALKLWEYPEFDPRKRIVWLPNFVGDVGKSRTGPWTEEQLATAVYKLFSERLDVKLVRMSQLVKIQFESAQKPLAATVANKVAEVYIDADRDARFTMAQTASAWLNNRLAGLRQKLDDSEKALQHYREQHGLIALKADGQGGASAQISEVTTMLVTARMRRAEAENAYRQMRSVKNGDYASVPAVVNNPLVLEARRQEAEAERKVAELAQRYGPEHPKMVQAEGELKTAQQITQRQVDIVVASLNQSYDVALGTERSLEQTLMHARGSVAALNRKEMELASLEREVASNRQLFQMFMNRAKETTAAQDLHTAVARIVDPARVPELPIKPKKAQNIVVSAVLAVLLGAMVSLLLDRLDNRIHSTDDVEKWLTYPLLAGLPLLPKTMSAKAAFLVEREPASMYAEAIATARTGILLSSIDSVRRTLLITSSVPAEGKTTFSIGLALALAHTRKTLLIDADMRKPSVSKFLDLDPATKGLSNLVAGTVPPKNCLQTFGPFGLHIIAAGDLPPNPLELLLSNRFKEILRTLAEIYDVILIDSPPVDLVSDALVLAPLCTNTIFMIKADATPYPLARKSLRRVAAAGGNIVGITLSHLDYVRAERYFGQTSSYGIYGGATYNKPYSA